MTKQSILLLCGLLGVSRMASADVTLARGGVAKTAIYVAPEVMAPDKATDVNTREFWQDWPRQRLRESVKDLALYLEKMSGAQVEVVTGAQAANNGQVPILIGQRAVDAFGPPARTSAERIGWRMVVSPKGVGLMGEAE